MAPKKVRRSLRPKPSPKKGAPVVPMVPLIIGAVLLMVSVAFPWGIIDVKTKLGPIPVTLHADVYEYGVSYTADLSGTGGLFQGTGDINRKISDQKVFVTGLGSFQETIGFIKGSSKYRNHTIELYTVPENNKAKVVVETYSATIPWWPINIPEEVHVTVRIIDYQPVNVSYVEVQRVWFELHQTVNGNDRYKTLWESKPGDRLKNLGDEKSYMAHVTVGEELGNFSVVGRAQCLLMDKNNKTNDGHELKSFAVNPKMINLWTVSQGQTVRIGMLLVAMPLTAMSALILAFSTLPAYLGYRWAWKMAAFGAVLGLLALVFYILGVGALIELTGWGSWFKWSPLGPVITCIGGALGIVGTVLMRQERGPAPEEPPGKVPDKAIKVPKGKKARASPKKAPKASGGATGESEE